MRNDKLIESLFASSSSRTPAVIALLAGLAVGAVVGVLFAPESGESARKKIKDAANGLLGNSVEEPEETEPEHQDTVSYKKPKSDIKSLIHDAHVAAAHAE
ncbi:YtxH domain-containing protein [Pedobacter metabolipauper]|uniref:YtxH-like protein n=1 Tax=Pedobacter metabolipauper TaxID=425513 RepID=A0A4R6T0F9_9SPHI|nr:YtxH domain-containing protein [Pedobacter metabolipauper]TDQ11845.1 YtxH-like protein [Pedobacter metabolipauper]